MSLISGKEAKLAWANDEEMQIKCTGGWFDLAEHREFLNIFDAPWNLFRVKPRTITINGIEVPAPFKPKEGDTVWCLNELHKNGYEARTAYDLDDLIASIAFWRTEDEIKQVVEALRSIFK